MSQEYLLLTPGFSPVEGGRIRSQPFQRFSFGSRETVETVLPRDYATVTGLKPGVNEKRYFAREHSG